MSKFYDVRMVRVDDEYLRLVVDGHEYRIALDRCSPLLKAAPQAERDTFKVLGSGYGIHWPTIDEDLSVRWLLDQAQMIE